MANQTSSSTGKGEMILKTLPFIGFFAMFSIPFILIAAAGEGESRVIIGTAVAAYLLMVLLVVVPNFVLWRRRQGR